MVARSNTLNAFRGKTIPSKFGKQLKERKAKVQSRVPLTTRRQMKDIYKQELEKHTAENQEEKLTETAVFCQVIKSRYEEYYKERFGVDYDGE